VYPRNAASPPRISIGAVVQISDGAVQTSGVAVKVIPQGGSEASGAGTVAYTADGVVLYTPTQGETDYTAFALVASKAGCIPATVTVVTSASETAGYAGIDWAKVGNPTTAVALSSTTISTSQTVASVSGAVGSVTNRVTANTDQWGGVAVTGMPMPTYTQPTGGAVASVTGNVGGDVVGSVGSISGVTFPTHFANLEITANGHVSAVVQSIANNSITASSIQGGAITAAKFATDAITAAALATDAVQEIQSGLATLNNQTTILDRQGYALAVLAGTIADAQTAAETYAITIGGSTYTVDFSGLDASGNRGGQTLTKT
jgi:hypothetical protein